MSGSALPFMQEGTSANRPCPSATLRGNSKLISMIRNPGANEACSSDIGGSPGSAFNIESSLVAVFNTHDGSVGDGPANVAPRESAKRRRGRPRKYGPDGTVASLSANKFAVQEATDTPARSQKRGRGRPTGSGRKQQLALLGEWVESSAGTGLTPHVIIVPQGEDIALRILQFSQQSRRAVFVMSASGSVSAVTLQCPKTPNHIVTHQGYFDILCLAGSYLLSEKSQARTGSLSISLSHPNGVPIGGAVRGPIVAATAVQLIVGSFIYGGTRMREKGKGKQEAGTEFAGDSSRASFSTVSPQNFAHSKEGWPPNLKQMEMRPGNIGINLTRG